MAIDHWPSGGDFVDGDHHIFGGGSRVVIENNNFDICRNILLERWPPPTVSGPDDETLE